ncbi:MAG: DNA polymerase [Thermofilaceae archaeon]
MIEKCKKCSKWTGEDLLLGILFNGQKKEIRDLSEIVAERKKSKDFIIILGPHREIEEYKIENLLFHLTSKYTNDIYFYYTNLCKCNIDVKKGNISFADIEYCYRNVTLPEIEILRPTGLFLTGKVVARTILQDNTKLEKLRGNLFIKKGIPCVVSYHLLDVIKQKYKNYKVLESDLMNLVRIIKEKNRNECEVKEDENENEIILTNTEEIISYLKMLNLYEKEVSVDIETSPINFEIIKDGYSKLLELACLNPLINLSGICYIAFSGSKYHFSFPFEAKTLLKKWNNYVENILSDIEEIKHRIIEEKKKKGEFKSRLDLYWLYSQYGFSEKAIDEIIESQNEIEINISLEKIKRWFKECKKQLENAEKESVNWDIDEEKIKFYLIEVFSNKGLQFYIQNAQFEYIFIKAKLGIELKNFWGIDFFDYLCGFNKLSLQEMEKRYFLNTTKKKFFEKISSLKTYMAYNLNDAKITRQIALKQKEKLKEKDLLEQKIISPYMHSKEEYSLSEVIETGMEFLCRIVTPVVSEMKLNGLVFDIQKNNELKDKIYEILNILYTEVEKILGLKNVKTDEFKKRFYALYKEKEGKEVKTTSKGSPSLSKDTLISLYKESEDFLIKKLILLIYSIMRYEKLLSSYVEKFPFYVHPRYKRCYPTYNIIKTASGRLSCDNPNIQQIPREGLKGCEKCYVLLIEEKAKQCNLCGGEIKELLDFREVFKVDNDDNVLVLADFSQIEMAVLAELSRDEILVDAINKGLDMHSFNASKVYGIPYEEIVAKKDIDPLIKNYRQNAKKVTFAVIYGATEEGIAERENLEIEEAKKIIETFYATYPETKKWIERQHNNVKKIGCVISPVGRIRWFIKGEKIDKMLLRQAQNTPIQSFASDLNLISCYLLLQKGYKISGTVHDSIIIEIPKEKLPTLESVFEEILHTIEKLKDYATKERLLKVRKIVNNLVVKLKIEWKAGSSWKEAKT